MKIAVASGKGGTGKTTVALTLAELMGKGAYLADCDVEEPNCHLFLSPEAGETIPVTPGVPHFAVPECSGCGKCVAACRFKALARLGKKILVFEELCHYCGNCMLQCPEKALTEKPCHAGDIKIQPAASFTLVSGIMKVGFSMAPAVIRELKKVAGKFDNVIFDAPPGTSCPMVTTIRGCDYVILVTEPTPFGLHDLALAYQTVKTLGKKCGVILNRAGHNDALIGDFCRDNGVELLLKIPFDRKIASGYSRGETLLASAPELREKFQDVLKKIGFCDA